MVPPPPRTIARRHWLFTALALIAMAAQLVLAFAPLEEGRDGRPASHVESGGTRGHFAHNDATCASCQARSIHSTTPKQSTPLFAEALRAAVVVGSIDPIASTARHPVANPRAPPSVI